MNIFKICDAQRLLLLILFLKSAAICSAVTEQSIRAMSLKQLCAQALIGAPEHVFRNVDRLHADKTSVEDDRHIMIPAECIRRVLDRRAVCIYTMPAECNSNITFSLNGKQIAAADYGTLYIWCEGVSTPALSIETDSVGNIRNIFFMNDAHIGLIGDDNTIGIWDIEKKECINRIPVKKRSKAVFNSVTNRLCVYGPRGLDILNATDGTCEQQISGYYQAAAFNFKGDKIAVRSDYDIRIINIGTQQIEHQWTDHSVKHLAFSPAGDYLALCKDRVIRIHSVQTGKWYKDLLVPKKYYCDFFCFGAFSGDKLVAGLYGAPGGVCVFNVETGQLVRLFKKRLPGYLTECSPDGSTVASMLPEPSFQESSENGIVTYDICYEKEEDLRLTDIEEQRLMLQAASCWKEDMPCLVDPNNPIFQSLLVRIPHLRKERYFVFSEPLPSAPMASSSTLSASSADA